ncbi:hypothetical protein [Cetobacterium sp.]|uniref:hypothetical protein n=1 Tax=Cetobacterium sp. TaxID=2071632 RepID=UPI003EE5ACAC
MIIVDEALKIINKFIPDKNTQNQMEIELKKLEVEDFNNKRGTSLEKAISMVFPLIAFIFCGFLISNLLGMWIGFIFKTESPIFPIDDRMYQIIMVYLTGFFGNRSIKSWRGDK